MAFESEKFLIDLAKQLNLKNMDDATRARLKDLKDKGVATKKQQGWDPTKLLPKIDDITPADPTATPPEPEKYTYTGAPTAGGATPGAADLKDLYLKLVVVLRDINADKELRNNDPTKKFLDTFYGPGKAVEQYESEPVPATYPVNDIADYIDINKPQLYLALGIKESDLEKLSNALRGGSYATNAKALSVFENFLAKMSSHYYSGTRPLPGTLPAGLQTPDEISEIYQKITTPKDPSATQLAQFMAGEENLFGKLVTNEKLREKFVSKDAEGDITKWINKGLYETNYKDGDHALAPKYTDRKTFWKRAKDNIKKWEVDTVGKLKNKHTRHIYSTDARFIVPELIDKGVKPTDGTGKILETLGAVIGNLPNPVQKKVKWIKETMTKMSGTDFFKDALKDGDQMRQLVQEIIKAAAHDDKKEEAKVALEILAVMRYTMTTSSVRDKLKKTELSILSDPKLSWNKGLVANVTRAIDKTIHTGMMAAFEIGNLAKNALKENGVKFKQGTGRLDKRTTDSAEYTDPAKRAMMEELFAFWDFVNSSANTKDYNILASHKAVQEQADNPITGGTVSVMHDKFDQFYNSNSIGR
ncbi:MAG: hypothetical protein E7011_03015 [Alphaproteobacteria bacterium]|nr:hypothetical protein [Alphaproteobacteria bacterium]